MFNSKEFDNSKCLFVLIYSTLILKIQSLILVFQTFKTIFLDNQVSGDVGHWEI